MRTSAGSPPLAQWGSLGGHQGYSRIGKHIERFGKYINVTDHLDWSNDEIVQASLDRYVVESAFRQSKGDDLVSVMPIRSEFAQGAVARPLGSRSGII